ncbi:hypothetical protein C6P40_005130, partial [Pichia californica]
EDVIPAYDSNMCTNNSLINDSSVILASNSLDLKPQKKKVIKDTTPIPQHIEDDADVIITPIKSIKEENLTSSDLIQQQTTTKELTPVKYILNKHDNDSNNFIEKKSNQFAIKDTINDVISRNQQQQQQQQQHQQQITTSDKGNKQSTIETLPSFVQQSSNNNNTALVNNSDVQRQLYEQKLEQKKMDQFRKLNMMGNSDSSNFAKSISPMSPKTT